MGRCPLRGLGTGGKRAASGRFAYGESDPQVGRETSRQASAQPAKIERPGKNPNVSVSQHIARASEQPRSGYEASGNSATRKHNTLPQPTTAQ